MIRSLKKLAESFRRLTILACIAALACFSQAGLPTWATAEVEEHAPVGSEQLPEGSTLPVTEHIVSLQSRRNPRGINSQLPGVILNIQRHGTSAGRTADNVFECGNFSVPLRC